MKGFPLWAIHPFLLAAFPVLSLYRVNGFEVALADIAAPIALLLAFAALVLAACISLIGEPHLAALVASLFLVQFFLFLRYDALANRRGWGRTYRGRKILALGLQTAVFVAAAVVVALLPRGWRPALSVAFDVGSAILVLDVLVQIIAIARTPKADVSGLMSPVALAADSDDSPDIYYIILDGYGRSDVLRDIYGWDNEGFLGELEWRGFSVCRRSICNYGSTPFSLSSALNFRYLDPLAGDSKDHAPLRKLIHRNAIAASLAARGYEFISFATGFAPTDIASADIYLSRYRTLNEFHLYLIQKTPLPFLIDRLIPLDPYRLHRERALFTLGRLPEVAKRRGRKFVFAHVLSPHSPFVFDAEGRDVSRYDKPYNLSDFLGYYGDESDYVEGYRQQIQFLNSRALEAIDGILANSERPPVIVLQSDHGPGLRLVPDSAEESDVVERMSILNAYHLPGPGEQEVIDGISPVNSFRVVLNRYFGASLPLLPDESFFQTTSRPFRFTNVTARLKVGRAGVAARSPEMGVGQDDCPGAPHEPAPPKETPP